MPWSKSKQLNNQRCSKCGHYLHAPGASWTAQSKPFHMVGESAATLERVPAPQVTQINVPAPQAIPGARIETPISQQSVESNVKVPLAQAVVTGALAGVAAACTCFFVGMHQPLLVTTCVATIATAYKWNGGLSISDSLLVRVEDYTGVDLNNDGQVGSQPVPHTSPDIKRGLDLWNGNRRLTLLPTVPEHQVKMMARKTAVLYSRLDDDTKDNFSTRHLGAPWGNYLKAAKSTLSELGYIKLHGNSTYKLSDSGKDWLLEAIEYA